MIQKRVARLRCVLGFLILGVWGWGCGASPPFLMPERSELKSDKPADSAVPQLKVSIRPVITGGFGAGDRQHFGVDLSAHFTAFLIYIQNDLPHRVRVDSSEVFLRYDDQEPMQALSEEESVKIYRFGDSPRPVLTLVPKARKIEKDEISKIREFRLRSAILPPGAHHEGVVYFHRTKDRTCETASLSIEQIQIDGEENPQKVQFQFRCEDG